MYLSKFVYPFDFSRLTVFPVCVFVSSSVYLILSQSCFTVVGLLSFDDDDGDGLTWERGGNINTLLSIFYQSDHLTKICQHKIDFSYSIFSQGLLLDDASLSVIL